MQTTNARPGASELHQRTSPVTPRTAREQKMAGSETEPISSPLVSKAQKGSPKVAEKKAPRSPVIERRSPRSLVSEQKSPQSPLNERRSPKRPVPELKKRPSRVSELEAQLNKVQQDLKNATDRLGSSEARKKQAQEEAEKVKKQLAELTAKLGEAEHQLVELSASEEAQLQELHTTSQECEKVWEFELEAARKQNAVDTAALETAMNEIVRLKAELDILRKSEADQCTQVGETHAELQNLKLASVEMQSLVEHLKSVLRDSEESKAQAQEKFGTTLQKLEEAKMTIETLESDGIRAREAYNSVFSELVHTRAQVHSLEELVRKLQADMVGMSSKPCATTDEKHTKEIGDNIENGISEQLEGKIDTIESETEELRLALEAAEIRCQEEQIRNAMQIHSAYELAEQIKSESSLKEEEFKTKLMKNEAVIEELKANLMDKENELQNILEENEGLSMKVESNSGEKKSILEVELKKAVAEIAELKAGLLNKEREAQSVLEENEMLKSEIRKKEVEQTKLNNVALAELEVARAAEREALTRLGYVTEEADMSSRKVEMVTEQLEAAQAANSEMDAELRRIKVQSDQWRKAAEAAAAVLSAGSNGKLMERSGSLDGSYNPVTGRVYSPYVEDMDDDSPKKKNNMLKKIGVMWKKGK